MKWWTWLSVFVNGAGFGANVVALIFLKGGIFNIVITLICLTVAIFNGAVRELFKSELERP